ncbi:hypothetical protein MIB92_03455 [Aestuariirhabdus sp. Z084]|uniref:hypothetical protein n=1 Tax=Aestuariirhabdus haliotis TaxID=2918751 RepID=UPI00201B392E|nr:hypothetical protein [Aestuariirhabdus haliotis]MCL6414697.1 hypothetical protein [Aestuariirhabdus haliotis]MCL6418629.1 hypothetical protein [Aestuariirhabdus haliotis]
MIRCLISLLVFLWANSSSAQLQQSAKEYSWDGTRFRVPIVVQDRGQADHNSTPVTSGVPLPFGIVSDVNQLSLEDENGNPVASQITVLSRYWARDNSLRWVLLDYQVSLKKGAKKTFWLTNKPPKPQAPFLNIKKFQDRWELDNGKLQLILDLKGSQLFHSISVMGQTILSGHSDDGLLMESYPAEFAEHQQGKSWNTHGWSKSKERVSIDYPQRWFKSHYNAKDISLEMNGSQRAVILVRGAFSPLSGKPLKHPFYQSDTRIHLYRNSHLIRIEHSVGNSSPKQPFWILPYRINRWQATLDIADPQQLLIGTSDFAGGALTTQSIAFDNDYWIAQGGPSTKKKHGRYTSQPGPLLLPDDAKSANSTARYLAINGSKSSLLVTLSHFWQKAPQRLSINAGKLAVDFNAQAIPANTQENRSKPWYQLDIGERTYHDLLLVPQAEKASVAELESMAQAFQYPLRAMAPVNWYRDTEVWYQEIDSTGYPIPKNKAPYWVPNRAGYRSYGEERSYNSGGHHQSLVSSWLAPLQERTGSSIEREEARSLWSINHNPGLHYRLPNLIWSDKQPLETIKKQLAQWNQTTGFGAKEIFLWASSDDMDDRAEGRSYLNFYKWLPDIEHYALFRIFEWYYLTGSPWALDTINGFVNWDLNFQNLKIFRGQPAPLVDTKVFERDRNALRRAHYSRIYNWMLYTNLAGYHATGNPVMDYFAKWQIRRALKLIRLRNGQLSNWKDKPIANLKSPKGAQTSQHPELFSPLSAKLYSSKAKTWMEAQAPLAFHEAYKTYMDERILDALWAQTDYFANNALFFPDLGLFNETTSMPHRRYGKGKPPFKPLWHDRYLQALPLLFYYSGDNRLYQRYKKLLDGASSHWVRPWFTQVYRWQQSPGIAKKSNRAPKAISDLTLISASRKDGIQLQWTSPEDDGVEGKAKRYFAKISNRPIVEYAQTNHSARTPERDSILQQVEQVVREQSKGRKKLRLRLKEGSVDVESDQHPLHSPEWQLKDAFWMAEHLIGEPIPSAAGTTENYHIEAIRPHAWFGLEQNLNLSELPAGTYYVAIKSWDDDQNLSAISNLLKIDLK